MSGRDMRFRVIVGDRIVHEAWAPETPSEQIAREETDIVAAAIANGDDFTLEMFDPDLPPEYATMRIGSTAVRMQHATLMEPEAVTDAVMTDYRRRLASAGLLDEA